MEGFRLALNSWNIGWTTTKHAHGTDHTFLWGVSKNTCRVDVLSIGFYIKKRKIPSAVIATGPTICSKCSIWFKTTELPNETTHLPTPGRGGFRLRKWPGWSSRMFVSCRAMHWLHHPYLGAFEFGQCGAFMGCWRVCIVALLYYPVWCTVDFLQHCCSIAAMLHPMVFRY